MALRGAREARAALGQRLRDVRADAGLTGRELAALAGWHYTKVSKIEHGTTMPTEADLKGPLSEDIKRYYQAARADAFDRVPLFRLAWDTAISAFGSRQVLYERFFFGDPVRMAGALVTGHNRQIQEYAEKVRAFVREGRDEALGAAHDR